MGRTTAVVRLAEQYDYVIRGDPDRDTIDVAVVDASTGRWPQQSAAPCMHAHAAERATARPSA